MKKSQVIKLNYYDQFACKGSSCRATCCKGWGILASKEETRRIKQLLREDPETPGDTLFKRRDPKDRTSAGDSLIVLDKDRKCPLITENGLCGLQCKHGAAALPEICRTFPRELHKYGDSYLCSLALGCEKVLETILVNKNKITLETCYETIDHKTRHNRVTLTDKKGEVLKSIHFDIFNLSTVLLQAEDVALEDKIILLGMAMKRIDELFKSGKILEVPQYCQEYLHSLETIEDVSTLLPKLKENPAVLLNNYLITMEVSPGRCEEEKRFSDAIQDNLGITVDKNGDHTRVTYSVGTYAKLQEEYWDFMQDKEHFMENVLLSFLYFRKLPFWRDMSNSVWENYMYFVWIGSIAKFYITASMPQIHSEEDMIDRLTFIFRSWGHNAVTSKKILEHMHENSCDDLAHMAVLLKSC